ncbi:hypothetical protein [Paenibacillus dauci]|uniref:hypothetical protein n=1 Tax=Paenibacillus dauci TaxID=1567106 RepID=UPI0012E09B4A|nr:hypothetical protein [Paenibacillus dauci]
MEKQSAAGTKEQKEFAEICAAIVQAEEGSQERLIAYFQQDMQKLSRYIRLPEEEIMQALQTDLLEYVIRKIKSTEFQS